MANFIYSIFKPRASIAWFVWLYFAIVSLGSYGYSLRSFSFMVASYVLLNFTWWLIKPFLQQERIADLRLEVEKIKKEQQ